MASLTGSNSDAALVLSAISDNYGTANAATASADRLVAESITISESVSELELNSIGAGLLMSADSDRGDVSAAASINMKGGYNNAFAKIFAQFFGAATAPAEQTGAEGDYLHRLTLDADASNIFTTIAYEEYDAGVREIPSATCTDVTLTWEPDAYLDVTANYLGNEVELATAVNTNAVLAASGEEDTERIVVEKSDEFLINAQAGGALASPTDRIAVTQAVFNFTRPQNFIGEIKGSAGQGEPNEDGLVLGTLTLTLKESLDLTFGTAAQAGTEYKCSIATEGTQIGAGVNKRFEVFVPRLKPIVTPEYNLTDTGLNPKVITFKMLAASANPTGMNDVNPYVEVINERTTTYTAA